MNKLEKNLKKKCAGVKQEKKTLHQEKVANAVKVVSTTREKLDLTEDLINMFIRFEVQRRYFNVISMEVLALQYG